MTDPAHLRRAIERAVARLREVPLAPCEPCVAASCEPCLGLDPDAIERIADDLEHCDPRR